jgi:Type IV secretion-system coupling protein DNA-binding domain
MTDRIVKFRPALLTALIAFAATALLAYASLFIVAPPGVEVKFAGRVPLNGSVALGEIYKELTAWRCSLSDGPFYLICRWRWLFEIPQQLVEDRVQVDRLINLASAPFIAAVVAFFLTNIRTPPVETVIVKAGRRVLFDEYARRAIQRFIRGLGRTSKEGLWLLPNVQLSRAQEARNVILLGTQGSGKTGLMRAYITQLLARTGLTFILDIKGDMVAGLPVDRFILVAAHDARTWELDLGGEIRGRQIAAEFAVKSIGTSKQDPMWAQAARAILADLAMVLRARNGENWSWMELRDLALSSSDDIRSALAEIKAPSASLITFGNNPDENRAVMSILITLWVAILTTIHPLAEAFADIPPARRFTVRAWMQGGAVLPRALIFQKSPDFPELSSLLGSFLAERIAAAALSPARRNGKALPLAMLLDEFSEVPINRLDQLLSLGRESNVMTIGALQSLHQLKSVADADKASTIEERFGIRLVLRLEPGDTTKRIAETWLGERRIARIREATAEELKVGITKPRETVREPVIPVDVLTDELGVRKTSDGLVIRLLVSGFPSVGIADVPLTAWSDRREAHVPAAWLSYDPPS